MRRVLVTGLLSAVLMLVPALHAQGPVGTLNGTITDPNGAVVPGAAVVATNTSTGQEAKTTATSTGDYTLPYLPAGTYTIHVTAPGFSTAAAENVTLRVAQTMTVNVKLEVGTVSEQVVVSDKPELLESSSAEMGQYITTQEYKAWPVTVDDGQRQIQSFIFSSLPGTTGDTFQGSINGGQQYSHEILIEGIPVGRADLSGGNNNEFSPSAEAIGEFKLQTGAIGAQYNGGQTAVANFTIKSGTNDLHGSGFYYLQNEALNSIPLQDKTFGETNSRNRTNNWGYSIGGPVYIPKVYNGRNRTFFFTNFEKTEVNQLTFGGFNTLATPAFKGGDFSALFDPNFTGNPLSGTQVGTDALGRPIVFGQLYNPATTRTLPDGSIIRDPFQGNIVPQSAWDPVARNVIEKIGVPDPQFNTMLRNIQSLSTNSPFFHEHIVGVKIDHQINGNNRISGYYNQSYRNRNNNACSSRYLPIPGAPTSCWTEQTTPGNMVRLSLTSTISPTLVNRLAAGYNRFLNENGAPPETLNKDFASQIGLQNLPGTMFPRIRFSGNAYQGGTISQMGVGNSDYSPNGSYIYQDDLTWIHGAHSFNFGYDFRRYYYNDRALSDAGTFNFTARSTDLPGFLNDTGHAFASFLLGGANSASHNIVGYSQGFRQPEHALYAMDDWKISPNLTLNIGFRWEIIPPFYEVTDRMSEVDLNVPNPEAGNLPGALVFKRRFNDTYWKEFGPRFGIAYKVSDRMVVRAGYAITNTPPIANGWGYGGFTFGFNGTVNVPAGTNASGFVDDPAVYLSQPFPTLSSPLPNKNPSSANYNDVTTTARDANRPGYTQNYNFTIQYALPGETLLEFAYVGNKGTRLWGGAPGSGGYSELNGIPASFLSNGDILNEPVSLHPEFTPFPGFDDSLTVAQALRPHPQYFGVQENFPYNTNSNYNSFQVTATRHLTSGLGFLAAYTWSKAIDYVDSNGPASYYTVAQDYYNRSLDRSVASFNIPQSFKLTWVWDTPFGKDRRFNLHWANPILGGWQLASIHNYTSGNAVNVSESGVNSPAGFSTGIRPDVVFGQKSTVGMPSKVDVQDPTPYLNAAAFTESPLTENGTPLRVGTAPRYLPTIRGPANLSETFRISKRFYMGSEKRFFGVGATMTNPLKRKHASFASQAVEDPAFGMLLDGGGDRTIQLDARIEF